MQVCTLLQTDNHTSTPPLSFLQAGCPSCRPTNSDKALKANKALSVVVVTRLHYDWLVMVDGFLRKFNKVIINHSVALK